MRDRWRGYSRAMLIAGGLALTGGCQGDHVLIRDTGGADTAALLSTDTLAWYREGRPVQFAGRHWRPAGKPVALDTGAVHTVGEFEGMTIYVAREEEAATARYLLFPLTDSLWQALEPADSGQIPRSTGTGSVPE